jgi:hypothetical protein
MVLHFVDVVWLFLFLLAQDLVSSTLICELWITIHPI